MSKDLDRPEIEKDRDLLLAEADIRSIASDLEEPEWMTVLRLEDLNNYRSLPTPRSSDNAWRNTDLAALSFAGVNLVEKAPAAEGGRIPSIHTRLIAGDETGGQIIFHGGGKITRKLDESIQRSGVIFDSIASAARKNPELVKQWFRQIIPGKDQKYAALASAIYDEGLCVYVPDGVRVEKPLQSLMWLPGNGIRGWRLLVMVGEGASLKLFHENASLEGTGLADRSGIIEIRVGRGGELSLTDQQVWGRNIRNIAYQRAVVQKEGVLHWQSAFFGGLSSKTFIDLDLTEEEASGIWSGMAFYDSNQRSDISTRQNHLAARTKSDLSYRVALAGRCRSAWSGMIYVAPGSIQSDGYQINRNLMLSDQTHADSIPGLEILTDDVRCSHGVSIGEPDPEEIFYLKSRGIQEEGARRLLVQGFFEPSLNAIPLPGMRKRIQTSMEDKLRHWQWTQDPVVKESRNIGV